MRFLFFLLAVLGAQTAPAEETRYQTLQQDLEIIAEESSGTARLFNLDMSDSGDMIQGLKIGDGPVKQLVVGTHHGNEYGSTEVAKALAVSLVARPIPGRTVFVIPVLNISGYNSNERRETVGDVTHDPNRDYPGPCGSDGPFQLKSTAALARFISAEEIVTSATLHTYMPAVAYPWGFSTKDLSTPFDDIFVQMAKDATVESQFPIGNSTEIIYAADGTFEDYAFWKHGIWSILFELGHTHVPDVEDLAVLVKDNVPGLRRMLANAPLSRAVDHDFHGRCDQRLSLFDLREE